MAVLTNTMMQGTAAISDDDAAAYQIEKSIRFNPGDDPYLYRKISGSGNLRTYTYSFWFKICSNKTSHQYFFENSSGGSPSFARLLASNDTYPNKIQIVDDTAGWGRILNVSITDPAAWMHLVVAVDTMSTSTSTTHGRVKIYLNGKLVTNFTGTVAAPAQSAQGIFNKKGETFYIGAKNATDNNFDGYIADFQVIDGIQLHPSAFGFFDASGAWQAKQFALATPNNGTTWSSSVTTQSSFHADGPAVNLFDGYKATKVYDANSGGWVKFTPPSGGIEYKQSIEVYRGNTENTTTSNSSGIWELTHDDGRVIRHDLPDALGRWYVLAEGTGTLTEIKATPDSGKWEYWTGIKIDGEILIDGQESSSTYNNLNDGRVWSASGFTLSNGWHDSSREGDQMFDGDYASEALSPTGHTVTWKPPGGLTAQRSIEIWVQIAHTSGDSAPLTCNGTNIRNAVKAAQGASNVQIWYDVGKTIDSTNGLHWGRDGGGNDVEISGIKVDGVILLDSTENKSHGLKFTNTSLARYLGQDTLNGAIADATGGLPIYNTTDDYGNVKGSGYRADSSAGTTDGTGLVLAVPGDALSDIHASINTGSSNVTLTAHDGAAAGNTTQSRFYGSSLYFDGSSRIELPGSSDFEFGTGDFTVEFWLYYPTTQNSSMAKRRILQWGGHQESGSWAILDFHTSGDIRVDIDGTSNAFSSATYSIGFEKDTWQHHVFQRASGTVQYWINGVKKATASNTADLDTPATNYFKIGGAGATTGNALNGYDLTGWIQDLRVYKGTAKYTANFKPATRTDLTSTNINLTADVQRDTPTNGGTDTGQGGQVTGNYCVLNPLQKGSSISLSDGNLALSSSGSHGMAFGTMGVSSGKWYWEFSTTSAYLGIGVAEGYSLTLNNAMGDHAGAWGYASNSSSSNKQSGDAAHVSYGSACASGDVIGVAFDADNGTLTFYKNGTSMGVAYSGMDTSLTYFPIIGDCTSAGNPSGIANFGATPFEDAAPAGHKALCTQNLPDLFSGNTKNNPSKYFDITTYQGTGVAHDVKDILFQPDFAWIKSRDATYDHAGFDAARGANKRIRLNTNAAEGTDTQTLTAFNSNGFTTGTDEVTNKADDDYVSWMWDAGTAAATASTDGSITPSAQWVNATAGFSISAYTGTGSAATIGHGLSAVPEFIMIKRLNTAAYWECYHKEAGATHVLYLNESDAATDTNNPFNDTTPTNTVFSVLNSSGTNGSSDNYIAYCWTPIKNFSSFGKYTGNASTDGPYINTGFRPRWLMVKGINYASNWIIVDSERDPQGNITEQILRANLDGSEYPGSSMAQYSTTFDFLSNGFKLRYSGSDYNSNGNTISYCAFAEHPFKTTRAHF